jgi:hypothetical protein
MQRGSGIALLGGTAGRGAMHRRGPFALPSRRRWFGAGLAVVALVVLTGVFRSSGTEVQLSTALLSTWH